MDNADKAAMVFGILLIGMLIGLTLNDLIVNPVTIEAKNQVCKELYGADYYFKDMRFGIEEQFNCQKDIEPEPIPEPKEKPLVVKLN